mmetsp:Transcript_29518/g.74166  ORF Transcript_29518/g.74166 Transcript_29518/m.74166 type:complete len:230 (-) Transcript_29518:1628-2317(-)
MSADAMDPFFHAKSTLSPRAQRLALCQRGNVSTAITLGSTAASSSCRSVLPVITLICVQFSRSLSSLPSNRKAERITSPTAAGGRTYDLSSETALEVSSPSLRLTRCISICGRRFAAVDSEEASKTPPAIPFTSWNASTMTFASSSRRWMSNSLNSPPPSFLTRSVCTISPSSPRITNTYSLPSFALVPCATSATLTSLPKANSIISSPVASTRRSLNARATSARATPA